MISTSWRMLERKKPGQEELFKGSHGYVSLNPFPSLHLLSKKDELWRNIQNMRDKENKVDMWLSKVEDMVDEGDEFWDFCLTLLFCLMTGGDSCFSYPPLLAKCSGSSNPPA
eukprot:TRINITY_DN15281_c1_g1_i1.p1 TRINITY_DN15281_c1_g1~~TRINITY_DN15281_c1_g1_i1.p1  ORF type:complete len:112 (-),score=34.71 TRINITY_DN15281_c1_g1_i1:317-652(-)